MREVTAVNTRFIHVLELVTSFHVAALALLFCLPLFGHFLFWNKPKTFIPVELTVVVPENSSSIVDEMNRILKQHHDVIISDTTAKTTPKPAAKPKDDRKTGPKLGPGSKNAKDKPLSEAEIKRLLALGYRPGEKNSIAPDEESRCFSLVKRAFTDAWVQPSYDEAGNAVAEVEVRFQKDGSIFGVRMLKPSGNSVLDNSVMQAATTVKRVDGLPASFLSKYDSVTIAFKVEPE